MKLRAKGVDAPSSRPTRKTDLIAGMKPVRRVSLPTLIGEFERVWHW